MRCRLIAFGVLNIFGIFKVSKGTAFAKLDFFPSHELDGSYLLEVKNLSVDSVPLCSVMCNENAMCSHFYINTTAMNCNIYESFLEGHAIVTSNFPARLETLYSKLER